MATVATPCKTIIDGMPITDNRHPGAYVCLTRSYDIVLIVLDVFLQVLYYYSRQGIFDGSMYYLT